MLTSARWTSLLFVIACGYVTRGQDTEYCYYDDQEPYIQYSTKSAYELIRAKHQPISIPSCKPVMVWASIRHGTQYPSSKTIEDMKTLLSVRDLIVKNHDVYKKGDLCEKDLQNFKNYTYRLSPSYEFKLSTQGKDDLRYMAKRMQAQFSQVLNTPYSPHRFSFFNDGTERTVESRKAFFDGLFGPDISDTHTNSSLLKSPLDCDSWVKQVKNNSKTYEEYEAFKRSNTVDRMKADVNYRLGFISNMSLDLDVIYLMYDTCRYEKAWYIASRPSFCGAFTKENLKVLEYLEDLKYYYEYSYGNDMNQKLACPLISDMVRRFSAYVENSTRADSDPTGVFYFSQTALHIPIITLLKMKQDSDRLNHNNFDAMSKRDFMSSVIDPFSANLVVALYECSVGERYRVVFYLNEDVFHYPYPGCEGGLCPWKTIYEQLKPIVESSSCNFDFCNSSGAKFSSTPVLLLCTLFAFVIHIGKMFQY